MRACIQYLFFSVKVLCEAGCNLSYLTSNNWQQSPLIWAIGHQNLEMVKLMVKHNVNLNEVSGYTRRTPLGHAVGDRNLGKHYFLTQALIIYFMHELPCMIA